MRNDRVRMTYRGGVNVFGLLGLLFVGLKLTGFIDWSWWFVTMPFWFFGAFVCLVLAVGFGVGFLWFILKEFSKRKKLKNQSR